MFEALNTPENRLEVYEYVYDRDDVPFLQFHIGTGFGIPAERMAEKGAEQYGYDAIIVVTSYTSMPCEQSVIDGVNYIAEHREPFLKGNGRRCVCTLHGNTYDVNSVRKCYDIHGTFVGFRLGVSNG